MIARIPRNPLHPLIQQATGAPNSDLALIENIMRDYIFHSTLDWQTSEQLSDAAREAFFLLENNRAFFIAAKTEAINIYKQMCEASTLNH